MSNNNSVFTFVAARWQLDWREMCGQDGLEVWSKIHHDLGLCFQHLCLEIPFLIILAAISAYNFGNHYGFVRRSSNALILINIRCFSVLFLTLLPIIQTLNDLSYPQPNIEPIDYFLSAVQFFTWFVHLIYLVALKNRYGPCSRGPISVIFMWTIVAMLNGLSFRSHLIIYNDSSTTSSIVIALVCNSIAVCLQIIYAITLVPSIHDSQPYFTSQYEQIGERSPLLGQFINNDDRFPLLYRENDPNYLGVAMEDTPLLSRLLFYWVNPLMQKGVQGALNDTDALFDLPIELNSTILSQKFDKALIGNVDEYIEQNNQELNSLTGGNGYGSIISSNLSNDPNVQFEQPNRPRRKHNVSLLRALHQCFAWQFYSIGLMKLIADLCGFAGPLLLNKLVSFIENKSDTIRMGYLYSFGLFVTTLVAAFCNCHFNFQMTMVGLKIRGAIITTVYRKTLTSQSTKLNSKFNTGEIVNFMSTDTDRIVNSCPSFHAVWSIPFQLFVTLYLLYEQVGISFLAGLIFSIVLIPINKLIASKIGELSQKMMQYKDKRVQLMTETLNGIRVLKFHVWEEHFIRMILKIRNKELKYLKGRKYLDALCVYFWATTPVLISILTFTTYSLMGNQLTAATVFTSIALLNMLIGPLNAFPWVLNGITEAWVSIKRIQGLLDIPDLDYEQFYDQSLLEKYKNIDVVVKNAQFSLKNTVEDDNTQDQVLNIQHSVGNNDIESITSSKDSFTERETASRVNQNGFQLKSINFTVEKGQFVGIMGPVGSGKSALLSSILAEIIKDCGSLAVADHEKGFGYVTQEPWLQRGTLRDNILFGGVYNEYRYRTVLRVCCLEDDIHMLPNGDLTGVGDSGRTLSGGQRARLALARAIYTDRPIYIFDDFLSAVDSHVAKHIFQQCILGFLKNKTRIFCTHHLQYLLHADYLISLERGHIVKQGKPSDILTNIEEILLDDEDLFESTKFYHESINQINMTSVDFTKRTDDNDSVLKLEQTEVGTVEAKVYGMYWKAAGHLISFLIIVALILMQTSRNATDLWLAAWVTSTNNNITTLTMLSSNSTPDMTRYLVIYGMIGSFNSIFTLFRAFLFAYGGIQAAQHLHQKLLKIVIKGKIRFFDVSPVGRILNRFSSDTYTIDDSLPFIFNILLAQLAGVIGSIIVTLYGLTWLCLVLVPLLSVYNWLQKHYRLTSRELKRLSSLTLSPIYSHFNETLQGLTTIRAFRAVHRFRNGNEENLEANQKTQFASQAASQWLSLRLQFIGVAMVTGVGVIAVVQHQFDVVNPGLVGLAISYALSVTGLLGGVINAFTETEREMIAVERVNQYIEQIVPEEDVVPTGIEPVKPPYAWPPQGVIIFDNVVLRYRAHISLQGVSFATRPAEKIGVVGRTGAGKSSLFAALFRMVNLYSGTIFIDTVDISKISLAALRTRLSIIPQEPFLFTGTVRENLDPLGEFRTQELWSALERCNLTGVIKRLGGLQVQLGAGGQNLSVGQRQLMCLARAVLHKSKILCIDEATANVDLETDRQIQQTIRSTFMRSTVITIAHRINTVMDSDRVIVMGDGRILEFDTPKMLMSDTSSHFYQLASQEQAF